MRRSPLVVIFFTVFIDLVGFGIILPVSPYLARVFHATPFQVGLLLSVYSLMQFIFSPIWGGLSDRIGRRPVILISLFGGGCSYLLFAFSKTLLMLFVARALAGLFGGNISAAQAYIADVTPPEERSKGMGLIGAAFGLGFIFGPLIGGLLGIWGQHLGAEPPFGMSFSALGAAAICLANFAMAYFVLKESLKPGSRSVDRRGRLQKIWHQIRRPVSGQLVVVFFLSGLAMAQMEAMLFPYVEDVFHWSQATASYGFAYVGVLMVIVQGYFIRKWMPKYGERFLLSLGLGLFALSLFGIAVSTTVALMAIVMTILAIGNGLMRPPNLGMISILTPDDEQGVALGVTNSLASLGRIIGPVFGGIFYEHLSVHAPFVFAGFLALIAFLMVVKLYPRLPERAQKSVNSAIH